MTIYVKYAKSKDEFTVSDINDDNHQIELSVTKDVYELQEYLAERESAGCQVEHKPVVVD